MTDIVDWLRSYEASRIAKQTSEAADTIEALRDENDKLRAILFQFAAYDESVGNVEMFTMTVPAGVIHAAADALKELGDE